MKHMKNLQKKTKLYEIKFKIIFFITSDLEIARTSMFLQNFL